MRPTPTARSIVIPLKEPVWRRWLWPLLGCLSMMALLVAMAALDEHDQAALERHTQQLRHAHEQGRQQGLRDAMQGVDVPTRHAYNTGWLEGLRVCHGGQP
jgi:hypothetical protein